MARVQVFSVETFYNIPFNLDSPSPELSSDDEGNAISPQINEAQQDFQAYSAESPSTEGLRSAPTFVKCEFPSETDVKPLDNILVVDDDPLDLKTEVDALNLKTECDVDVKEERLTPPLRTDHLSDEQNGSFVNCFVPAFLNESPDVPISIDPIKDPLAGSHEPNSDSNTLNQTEQTHSGPSLGTNFPSSVVRIIRINVSPDTNNTLKNNALQRGTLEHCSLCGIYYLNADSLQRHITRVHRSADHQNKLNSQHNELRKDITEPSSVSNTSPENLNQTTKPVEKSVEKIKQPTMPGKKSEGLPPQSRTCCHLCGKELNCSSMKIHMLHVHKQGKMLSCPQCAYTTTRGHALTQHIRTHTGVKPYTCTTCKRGFVQKHALERHVNSKHTKAVVFPCPFCPYSATMECLLHNHLRMHHPDRLLDDKLKYLNLRGPNEFVCEFCGRKFVRRTHFCTHIVTVHLKIDYYKCKLCDFQTTRKWRLTPHMLVHTKEKRYGCEECGKRFAQKSKLQGHMLRIHLFPNLRDKKGLSRSKGPRITCEFCGREIIVRNKTTLAKHIEKFHVNPDDARNSCKQTQSTRDYKQQVTVQLERTRKSQRKPKPNKFYCD